MKDNDWKIIDTLYQFNSLTKSADHLYTTQPSLTRRLRIIEEELGIVIANRTPKGLVFTEQGKLLAEKAREYLTWFDNSIKEIHSLEKASNQTLRVGVCLLFLIYSLPDFINQFNSTYPNITLDIKTGRSREVTNMLKNNEIDFGIIRGDHSFEGERIKLATDYGYIVSKDKLNFADLPSIPYIDYKRDKMSTQKINNWWTQYFSEPIKATQMGDKYDVCLKMISMGMGFGILFSQESELKKAGFHAQLILDKDNNPIEHSTWAMINLHCKNVQLRSFLNTIAVDYCKGDK
ncbi:MAG: LysR family transcriptional regulator [Lachnospiraceae bacterium]